VAQVFGRDPELAAIERLLDAAAVGPALLLLEGGPGMGKTTLWAAGVARATDRGFRVLQSRPAEAETRLAYASLSDLLAGVTDDHVRALPAPQCQALEAALLKDGTPGATVDRRSVSMAVLTILRSLAAERPLVIAIDDWQWVDPPSLRVLDFALRRLHPHPIATLVTVRAGSSFELDHANPEQRQHRAELGPLSLAALHHLLADQLDLRLPRPALVRLERASAGNPLFALEIGRAIFRSGSLPGPGEPLPVPETLREAMARRLAVLSPAAWSGLLVVAASARPTLGLLRQIQGERASRGLRAAAAAGVVEVTDDERIRFTHPLVAAIVLSSALPEDRGRAHRELARVVTDPEERAAHLARSGATAADLPAIDAGARSAALRGAPDIAAELGEHALALATGVAPDELGRRRITVAWYHVQAGSAARGRELLDLAATGTPPGPIRARALWRLGQVRYQEGSSLAAAALFTRALACVGGDPSLRAELERDTALALVLSGHVAAAAPHARRAMDQAERLGDRRLVTEAAGPLALVRLLMGEGRLPAGASRAPDDLGADDLPAGVRPNVLLGMMLRWSDQFDAARGLLEAEHRRAVEHGAEHEVPGVLWHLSELECWTGNWELAASYAETAVQAASLAGDQPALAFAYYARALVHACRGAADAARRDAESGLMMAEASDVRLAAASNRHVLGFLELSLADADAAHGWLAPSAAGVGTFKEPGSLRFLPDEAEALIGTGDLDQANRLLGPFEERAEALGRAWALAAAARCRGLLFAAAGDLPKAMDALDRALAHHAGLDLPLERGRTLLAKGRVHRRRKEKRRAREALEEAATIFDGLGARLWAQRTHTELARIGLRPPSAHDLSQTEAQVAGLAAGGLTNRQIARALFLSPRSVDGVIARIYQKLGIGSRAELGSWMARLAIAPEPQ
jgi:DNA-binding CsgD family transcriptional regulator